MVTTRRGTNTAGRPTISRRRQRRAVIPAPAPAHANRGGRYKPSDTSHRHALPDTRQHDIIVPAHRRRKP